MPTRVLIMLSLLVGLAILVAGAAFFLMVARGH